MSESMNAELIFPSPSAPARRSLVRFVTVTPEIGTRPDIGVRPIILPPHAVILHNDDHNEMLYVVRSLVMCVPELSAEDAVAIMLAAHSDGKAVVIVCPLERAELYRDRLESRGLTATIEKQ